MTSINAKHILCVGLEICHSIRIQVAVRQYDDVGLTGVNETNFVKVSLRSVRIAKFQYRKYMNVLGSVIAMNGDERRNKFDRMTFCWILAVW